MTIPYEEGDNDDSDVTVPYEESDNDESRSFRCDDSNEGVGKEIEEKQSYTRSGRLLKKKQPKDDDDL